MRLNKLPKRLCTLFPCFSVRGDSSRNANIQSQISKTYFSLSLLSVLVVNNDIRFVYNLALKDLFDNVLQSYDSQHVVVFIPNKSQMVISLKSAINK